jgi:pyridoxal 5'-phosphate synthase pdxS subunit
MADEENHINKNNFKVPFVCGCRDLGEALRRIAEGASMLRTKGEAGTGNIVEAVRHARAISRDIRRVSTMDEDELFVAAKVLFVSCTSYNMHFIGSCSSYCYNS